MSIVSFLYHRNQRSRNWNCSNPETPGRCNLCFLAIQQPGISKRCSLCERQYLDLDKAISEGAFTSHIEEETQKDDTIPSDSLIKRLFETFDTCPYCNGKFAG